MPPAEARKLTTLPQLALTRRGAARWRAGHPWIFRDDVSVSELPNGEIVEVLASGGDPLGTAFYSSRSKITLRRLAGAGITPDERFLASRIDDALAYRQTIAEEVRGLRLFSSDADGIPGLIVDRYGEHLVVQSLTAGADRRLDFLVGCLIERLSPRSVLARNEASARSLEGLPLETRVLHGEPPDRVEITEGGIRALIDLKAGQKTGWFLDQRENRQAASRYLRGRLLDAFCYDGGFSLHAARAADVIEAVDTSEGALARAEANAALNAFSNIRFIRSNVFDFLQDADRSGQRYDGVVLDPPAFAKSRKDLASGIRAYKEINLRAMKCLTRGGVLVTCSCSYNLPEDGFLEVLASAAADARRHVIIMEKRSQARDHPVLLGLPESHYLKCLILKVD